MTETQKVHKYEGIQAVKAREYEDLLGHVI